VCRCLQLLLVLVLAALPPAAASEDDEAVATSDWFARLPLTVEDRVDQPPRPFGSWATTAMLGSAALAVELGLDGPEDPRWRGGVLFDDQVRDALRGDSDHRRDRADQIGDVLRGGLWAWLLTDTALIRGREAQLRTWQINLDAALGQGAGVGLIKYGSGRRRPDGSDNRSFVSGHAASAATAAGLICTHHLHGGLYGGGSGDSAACAGAVTAAAATGIARIVADEHYATDVLAGWAVGAVFGYLLPRRWYSDGQPADQAAHAAVTPVIGSDSVALVCSLRW
jgi:hypothetical protein